MNGIESDDLLDLINIGPIVIYTCKAVGNFAAIDITGNVKHQLGYEVDEFLGEPNFWASHLHPDDASRVFDGLGVLFEQDRHSHEYWFQHKDGSYRWMQDHLRLIRDDSGRPERILGFWVDNTEHKKVAASLEQSLIDIVGVLADTITQRDPYTAGHQERVARLAVAIAKQMGLPEAEVMAINMGSLVHDLGKIHIPSEILSRSGKLSDEEFNLIKTHPQAGYEILKNVNLPWPVAEMILNHHERLDGSGYPHGLKGDDISLAVRILSVSDVVEAMSSHRPFRASLGLEAAREEIKANSGRLYDSGVVDACLIAVQDMATLDELEQLKIGGPG